MDKGVFLICFSNGDKGGYYNAALNLAISIKHHNKNIPIALCVDSKVYNWLFTHEIKEGVYFDKIIHLKDEDFKTKGRLDPAKAKTSIYDYLPFKENLYLDVDAVCIKDLQPLFDHFATKEGFYFTDVVDKGKRTDKIDYVWANNDVLWKYYNLSEDAIYPTIQSSFCYIRKCKEAKKFFKKVKDNFNIDFPHKELKFRWGGTLPDEMMFSAALAQLNINPSAGIKPIFFGHKMSKNLSQVVEDHYIIALYGNGGQKHNSLVKPAYLEFADGEMSNYVRAINNRIKKGELSFGSTRLGVTYQRWIKVPSIMADKHANN